MHLPSFSDEDDLQHDKPRLYDYSFFHIFNSIVVVVDDVCAITIQMKHISTSILFALHEFIFTYYSHLSHFHINVYKQSLLSIIPFTETMRKLELCNEPIEYKYTTTSICLLITMHEIVLL